MDKNTGKYATKKLPTILIVDDDVTTNELLRSIISRAGFSVVQEYDVAGGLAAAHTLQPDLILLDITLPDGSGFDISRRLQTESGNFQTPILFISSNDNTDVKVQAFASGGVDYITKPLSGPEVIARVKTHLRIKQFYESLVELQAEHIKRLATAQKAIMPQPSDIPDAHFFVSMKQINQAGGDFYDVIKSGDQIYDYIIADTRGHDLAASFWTASLKMLIAEYANPVHSPLEILRLINNALIKVLPDGVFFTVLYARLNRLAGKLTLAHGGHPPAIIVPADENKYPVIIRKDSDILGAFSDPEFEISEINIDTGNRLLLFTDGLVELVKKRADGILRITEAASLSRKLSLQEQIRYILTSLTNNISVQDDIMLMGVDV